MKKFLFIFPLFLLLFAFQPKEITWVAIGDSITYLCDHKEETGNRVTKGFLIGVTEKLPNIHYVNQGHNGWTAIRIATEFDQLGITKADVYTIFLGTNDWWQGKPLGVYADYTSNKGTNTVMGAFRIIIDKLRGLNEKAKIILITPMQRVDFVYINNYKNNAYGSYKEKAGQQLEQFANAINEIGKWDNISVVDLYHVKEMSHEHLVKFKRLKDPLNGIYHNYAYPDFIGIPFDPEKDEYPYPVEASNITFDGLHPSDKGYAIITEMLVKQMKKL